MTRYLSLAIAGGLALFAQPAWCGGGAPRLSAEDVRDLAVLAPPAPRATSTASYGDAPLARRHAHGRRVELAPPVGLFYCPDKNGRPTRNLCARDPRSVGFKQFYAYTPSYATSPQIRRDGRGVEPSLLPPATGFFYAATSTLFGNPPER